MKTKFAFTLVELLVVISIISVLFSLLLPAVQSVRESSRRLSCTNKLRQLVLAANNYHDVYELFPAGCDRYGSPSDSNSEVLGPFGTRRTSGFVRLLPYIEQAAAFDAIAAQMNNPSLIHPQAGFAYNNSQCYSIQNFPEEVRNFDAPFMACPSDSYSNKLVSNGNVIGFPSVVVGTNSRSGNYVQNLGDVVTLFTGLVLSGSGSGKILPNGRGPIGKYYEYSFHSITDGTSNTAIFTERCAGAGGNSHRAIGGNIRQFVVLNADGMLTNYSDGMYTFSPLDCMASYTNGDFIKNKRVSHISGGGVVEVDQLSSGFAGTAWYDGWSPYSWATFITPPNSTSCFRADELVTGYYPYGVGIFPPTSYHPRGVNVARADGSVIFVNDTVHCGDRLSGGTFYDEGMTRIVAGESEFGIWGSLGSKDGGEVGNF
ncbi:MAG: DUF1559 domain-containing protein [Planctomycetaceae bacterium]|jgi:prepilin-type N-terminal cleavage/methylation domain-containing protein/prepilin-type processing-associated H-X9-DG protein|nr:DUF1559 domain-containing protein [Planctomycetaceae bacterium]